MMLIQSLGLFEVLWVGVLLVVKVIEVDNYATRNPDGITSE